jgi:adenylate cyclase
VSQREPTRTTEVAGLEAKFNEDQVLAEGALLGERRVAWARLAMVIAFGLIANLKPHGTSLAQTGAGALYTVFTVVTLVVVYRITPSRTRRRRPMYLATVDFAFITLQGLLGTHHDGVYHAGMSAISAALLLTFAVARHPTYQVVYSMIWAPVSFIAVAAYAGELWTSSSVFIVGGLLVLGLMVLMTNVAVRWMFSGLRKRDNLARFLPRQVAERVLEAGPMALAPISREVTVMFSDIRGFTTMSEGMDRATCSRCSTTTSAG